MHKTFLLVAALLGAGNIAAEQTAAGLDTAMTVVLDSVEVVATRASENTPITFSIVDKEQIERLNVGQDLPFLLAGTPGLVLTSDAGNGVGYTSMSVRGTDHTRINITMNDIPLNDAESATLYWVDLPDIASALADVQIQRGVGTSTNGAAAFGASVNMRSQRFASSPYAHFMGSYGSFNTNKETVKVGSGVLHDHWVAEAQLSHIGSDGYRDRASTALWGYMAQLGYFSDKTSVRLISFGGKEDTYHAWDGISREQLSTDRTYNPNGAIKHDGKATGFYKDQKDIYKQFNFQLIWEQNINTQWKWKLAGHFTDGFGYYQEYKNARTLKEYGLEPVVTAEGTLKKSSLVRRKILDSNFGGLVYALNFSSTKVNATLGGGYNHYVNDHYGRVLWVENYTAQLSPDHEYYRNKAKKNDFNIYLKANYTIWSGLSAFADLQYRHVGYTINGNNDKWDWTAQPEHPQVQNIDERFDFFNPKAGLNWQIDKKNRAYASVAVAHREPTRNNYTDGLFTALPHAERLLDWEIGYTFTGKRLSAGINFYHMGYKDQLVLNGRLNEIGEPAVENVPSSYRMGVEITAGYQFTPWLRWDVNAAFSRNRIKNYVGYVPDYDADTWDDMWTQTAIERKSTTISFSPSVVASSIINVDYKGFSARLITQYVSRQYLDNLQNRDDSLDPYCVNHLGMDYTFHLPGIKSITAGITLYNLFNTRYECNGYSQTAALYKGGDKSGPMTLSSDPRFYPMAGINVMGNVAFKF